jgi:phage-related holin
MAFFAPIENLVMTAIIFVVIDFIAGVWASYVRAKRAGKREEWGFESEKAWHTITKMVFIIIGICMFWMVEQHVLVDLGINLHLTNIFTGFCCGIEVVSYLENAADISDHSFFRWLKKYILRTAKDKTGIDFSMDEEKKEGE